MTTDELIPTILSIGMLLVLIVVFVRLAKNRERTADLQYSIFLARRTSLVFAGLLFVGVLAVHGLLAVGLIAAGSPIGWTFVILASGYFVMLLYVLYVARLPFDPPADPDEDE